MSVWGGGGGDLNVKKGLDSKCLLIESDARILYLIKHIHFTVIFN